MPLTGAERQARCRARREAAAGETLEQAVERERRALLADYVRQCVSDSEEGGQPPDEATLAMLRGLQEHPPWAGDGFRDWFLILLNREVDDEVRAARRAGSRKGRARM